MISEALQRAQDGHSLSNYPAIITGFKAKGIKEQDILPRVNVFTFKAWGALGRRVNKGEHGVKITSWVPIYKSVDGVKCETGKRPKVATVFHISQTSLLDNITKPVLEDPKEQDLRALIARLEG